MISLLERARFGGVAELADALDLGSSVLTDVQVQFLSPPLGKNRVFANLPLSGQVFLLEISDISVSSLVLHC